MGAMRRYADTIEVQQGRVGDVEAAPELFVWHRGLWRVVAVQAYWVETGRWWEAAAVGDRPPTESRRGAGSGAGLSAGAGAGVGALLGERTVYRVEAGCGRLGRSGVFELAFDSADGRWRLEGVAD